MRLTYRTIRVLGAVGAHPGASNREIGAVAGMEDQGQTSRLLSRLAKLELIENTYTGRAGAGPNAWALTPRGAAIERATGATGRERSTGEARRSGAR
jgi:DNA-binding MarR family transcriptional regulator